MTELGEAAQALKTIDHWIGGKRRPGGSGREGPVYDPAKGAKTGEVAFASPEEIDLGVEAGEAGLPAWRALSLSSKAELYFKFASSLHAPQDIRSTTAEHGKVSDALGEVARESR
jgi:malonate-semialdehyde dehydrogenase (acetylating)/methylmalonate-semialdehyde dehydrogenase